MSFFPHKLNVVGSNSCSLARQQRQGRLFWMCLKALETRACLKLMKSLAVLAEASPGDGSQPKTEGDKLELP